MKECIVDRNRIASQPHVYHAPCGRDMSKTLAHRLGAASGIEHNLSQAAVSAVYRFRTQLFRKGSAKGIRFYYPHACASQVREYDHA
jgi:hypothetical protein